MTAMVEEITGGQIIMFVVFGLACVVMVLWQILLYFAPRSFLEGKRPEKLEEGAAEEASRAVVVSSPNRLFSLLHNEDARNTLQAFCSLGGLMLIFYLLDGPHPIFPQGERTYSRDLFLFVIAIIALAGGLCIIPTHQNTEKILNRDQTDEWKGWMQMIFVLYHYFAAKETYNFIRILIAGYVWLTGFGNFSFFWVRGDYSFKRVFKMLFRLNFLVAMICLTLNKPYMLYYICPMHTWWFLLVYATMLPFNAHNKNPVVAAAKFLTLFITIMFIYEVPGIFEILFSPLKFLLSYEGSLNEWKFRSGLDRYATVWGMLFAYFHPTIEAFWHDVESNPPLRRWGIKTLFAGAALGLLYHWIHSDLLIADKFAYNRRHPYTSIIPLLAYVVLRNLSPSLRGRYTWLWAFVGKISLESYLGQFHVWLGAEAKTVILLIPGYPMLNFMVASFLFVTIANLLFQVTQILNDSIFPSDGSIRVFIRNAIFLCATIAFLGWVEHLQNLARGYLGYPA